MKALEILRNLLKKDFQDKIEIPYNDFISAIAELESLQSKYEAGQLQYSKLWDMYSDLKKQLELTTKDKR